MNIEEILRHVIVKGDTVLDVGGHVGNVAWFMTDCTGPDGMVFSFEPHPEKFKALEDKARRYGNLSAINSAVSNSETPVTLYFGTDERSDQASTICADLATNDRFGQDVRTVQVPAVTLDRFCGEHGLHPAVIKIDVEGAEPFVLEGAGQILNDKPVLIFEMGVTDTLPVHLKLLRDRGYSLYFVDLYRFVGPSGSFEDAEDTETRALRNCIFSFDDASAQVIGPFLSNVLAVIPGFHDARLAGLRILSLEEAVPQLVNSRKSVGRTIKRAARRLLISPSFENRFPGLVAGLRKVANLFL